MLNHDKTPKYSGTAGVSGTMSMALREFLIVVGKTVIGVAATAGFLSCYHKLMAV